MAWLSSCSQNAHEKAVLVRRAQSRINQATLPQRNLAPRSGRGGEKRASVEGLFDYGSTCAIKILPAAPAPSQHPLRVCG